MNQFEIDLEGFADSIEDEDEAAHEFEETLAEIKVSDWDVRCWLQELRSDYAREPFDNIYNLAIVDRALAVFEKLNEKQNDGTAD